MDRSESRAVSQPTGTITFAFSDIEGSTPLWERSRAAMSLALQRHDEILREAIESHGGTVFKTVGDAFCAAFTRAHDAVEASIAAQRALASEDFSSVDGLRVRIGLHTGSADERDGDYFGPEVNRVARIMSLAYGGQVLLSSVTADLVRRELPSDTMLRDMGPHQVKGILEPQHIYQLLADGLRSDFPALALPEQVRDNLPVALTSFVGRAEELKTVVELLLRQRLVTLTGSGGVGKSRLAVEAAGAASGSFPGGVWLVEFAPIADSNFVATAIASTLGLQPSPNRPVSESIVEFLGSKKLLLVLDNCEHVVAEAARVAAVILRECRGVTILATSREPLSISGENMYRTPELAESDAVALFAARARAVDAAFTLERAGPAVVRELCRHLDGIPLAIELAAARVGVLSPKSIAERLGERFRVLTGGSRTALPRQQTLRALIDWSYELLSEPERGLFQRLSAFAGRFSLDRVAAVCGGESIDEIDVLDLTASLVDKSLVRMEYVEGIERYRLLESTRQYAMEKLSARGNEDSLARRHLRYFLDEFLRAGEAYESSMSSASIDALVPDLDDARAAMDWAVAHADVASAIDLFLATRLWDHLGLHREALERAQRYESLLKNDDLRRARLWEQIALLHSRSGDFAKSRLAAQRSVQLCRSTANTSVLGNALVRLGSAVAGASAFDEAEAAFEEAEGIQPKTPRQQLQLTDARGRLAVIRGDLAVAATRIEESLSIYRSIGNDYGVITTSLNLAEIDHERGETAAAVDVARNVLPLAESLPDGGALAAHLYGNLSGYLLACGEIAAAEDAARQALTLDAIRAPDGAGVAIDLECLALAMALRGALHRAALLEGFVDSALQKCGFEREYTERGTYRRLREILETRMERNDLEGALAKGAAWTVAMAVAEASA